MLKFGPYILSLVLFLTVLLGDAVPATVSAQSPVPAQNAKIHFKNGLDYAVEGNLELAIYEFRTAIDLDPLNPFHYYNLGIVLAMHGDFQQSVQAFKNTLRLKPDHLSSHFRLGVLYEVIGYYEKAILEYQGVLSLSDRGWEAQLAGQRITVLSDFLNEPA
jgi:tetratricopeptide (TPR) repeat protein